ncbi:MAG TPA: class II fructose-bisphosphate aldolase [bacterium]|nr:class II fructose-bisphosphate aldolase [bacterium]HOL35228.1 class II fructose-bisphosphate aldolase [bacterium]
MNPYMTIEKVMKTAYDHHIVIPTFNVAYLPMVKPISDALVECRTIGIIEVSRPDIENFGAKSIKSVAQQYENDADPKFTFLHLDHVPVIDEHFLPVNWLAMINEAIDLEFDSVMIDGSRLPFADNVSITKRVVEMAHGKNICVEAELGSVMGHEPFPLPPYEEIFEKKIGFTDPVAAEKFVKMTDVDWLSVSVGSIHGAITGAAKHEKKVRARIDIEHLEKIKNATGIPLVLHGGSGIDEEYIRQAIKVGITKINIGTEVRQAYEEGVKIDERQAQENVKMVVKKLIDAYQVQNSIDILLR